MKPRVVLVMVECACDDASVPQLETLAAQWAQDVRHRVLSGVDVSGAAGVVIDGSASQLRSAVLLGIEVLSR